LNIGEQILAKRLELIEMPEFQTLEKIRNFNVSLEIFDGNYLELSNALNAHNSTPAIMSQRNRQLLEQFQREITRLLHNFLASCLSLIDHTRVLNNDLYAKEGKFPDYQKEIDIRFKVSPLAAFIKDLRQYVQHYKLPSMTSEFSWVASTSTARISISLPADDISAFSGWSAQAKKYIQAQTADIDLISVVQEYNLIVMSFHQWFTKRQVEIHRDDVLKVENLKDEIRVLELANLVSLMGSNVKDIQLFEERFFHLFKEDELEAIKKALSNEERVDEILKLLSSRMNIGKDVIVKIEKLYGRL
jgi:hypothetical protein